ncbi:DUF6134 family protein [uncultured Pseudacidovorax sp.]|uniref:DUF6134 family protein n=1 Tax=uncultured Pseudacidovorax sp. TaxID=679313 RepID=UPI0025E9BF87|nr:DUF6134 family protein [uncultured Pseudacidovorax sp.]
MNTAMAAADRTRHASCCGATGGSLRGRVALAGLLALVLPLGAWAQQVWSFEASLDGKPIGQHVFTLETQDGGGRSLRSEARFDVKLLGITVYRYRHQAQERWQGDCLKSLTADTDDNGDKLAVRLEPGDPLLAGCAMSFAYWNRAILKQRELLNAQTGKLEAVRIEPLPAGSIDVRGQSVEAQRWRIVALKQRIDLWYDGSGRWVGLDGTLEGGKLLSYRLR